MTNHRKHIQFQVSESLDPQLSFANSAVSKMLLKNSPLLVQKQSPCFQAGVRIQISNEGHESGSVPGMEDASRVNCSLFMIVVSDFSQ